MPPELHRHEVDGAVVLVLEDHALPTARMCFASRRGSGADPMGSAGACRVMLELCLRGTRRRDRAAFADVLETMGSSLWTGVGREVATFSGACLARNLGATVDLAREALCEPAFATDERRALVDELVVDLQGLRDDDGSVADLFLSRALYGNHPLWRSPEGEVADLLRLGDGDVSAAYARHWAREEVILAFAGDISVDAALAAARPIIDSLPHREVAPAALSPPAAATKTHILVVDKPERTQIQMRLGRLTIPGNSPDILALWLGVMAFGGTFTSPFTHEVRELRGWSYSAYAGVDRRRRMPAPLVLSTAPALGDAIDCLALELELYGRAARGDVADADIERARAYALNRFPFEVATAADLLLVAVLCETLRLPLGSILELPIAAITPEEVRRALRTHLDPQAVSAVLVATAADVVEPLKARVPTASVEVIDYQDGLVAADGIAGA